MDIVDRAQEELETYEKFRNKRQYKEVDETGYCLFCGEPLTRGRRWCNADCRDSWEKEKRRRNK